jgi:hypothetical protein
MTEKTSYSDNPEEPAAEKMATPRTAPSAAEAALIGPSNDSFDRIGTVPVALKRAQGRPTEDQPLWSAIRNRTRAIGFGNYKDFIDRVLCWRDETPTTKTRSPVDEPVRKCAA